ncbi:hypothetical protein C8R45DRAFT_319383 [Mycena sanguinolenta]|nr:hypothetical protein C8R45DRAFT_319383 [Mycena sanguinolenta]
MLVARPAASAKDVLTRVRRLHVTQICSLPARRLPQILDAQESRARASNLLDLDRIAYSSVDEDRPGYGGSFARHGALRRAVHSSTSTRKNPSSSPGDPATIARRLSCKFADIGGNLSILVTRGEGHNPLNEPVRGRTHLPGTTTRATRREDLDLGWDWVACQAPIFSPPTSARATYLQAGLGFTAALEEFGSTASEIHSHSTYGIGWCESRATARFTSLGSRRGNPNMIDGGKK